MSLIFKKCVIMRVRNTFPPKSDVGEVLRSVLEQRVPGELHILTPGNGGVSSITFLEKEKVLATEEEKP